jgi:hypothetical protein
MTQVTIPFEASEALNEGRIKEDRPDVWARFLDRRTMSYRHREGATVTVALNHHDLSILHDYLCLWLHSHEDEKTRGVQIAVTTLNRVLSLVSEPTRPRSS